MKLAAEREEAKQKQEREEEEAARQPLLNDTSFDRRRVVAVYKDDGSRGHHMQVLKQFLSVVVQGLVYLAIQFGLD